MLSFPRPPRRFVPDRTGHTGPLGHLETAVMDAIWGQDEALSVAETLQRLAAPEPVAYNTVKTTLERLAEKGILTRVKEGKAYRYRAAVSREELERRIVTAALDRLVEQFPQAVASFFVRPDPGVSGEKLALLQEAVDRRRADEDG